MKALNEKMPPVLAEIDVGVMSVVDTLDDSVYDWQGNKSASSALSVKCKAIIFEPIFRFTVITLALSYWSR